jgi:hypothetical protein
MLYSYTNSMIQLYNTIIKSVFYSYTNPVGKKNCVFGVMLKKFDTRWG